jgi:hypothetical protein
MGDGLEPTKDEMRRAEIVLGDALPYELAMLRIALQYTQTPQFEQLKKDEEPLDWLTHNATVEAFWTHARCLLEFFNRAKNNNFDASSASARDFTDGHYRPSDDIKKLWGPGCLSEKINEQLSHVGFCRKTELYEKLGPEMGRVKHIIDKEVRAFDGRLRKEFREYWKMPLPQERFVLTTNVHTATCSPIIISATIIWPRQ